MPRVLIEVIACSALDCVAAEEGGADRIELCSAIELGGLTPSLGLLETALNSTRLPIIAMIRPRSGGFNYSREEFDAMLRDVRGFKRMGAAGVAFGVLTDGRRLDLDRMRSLRDAADGMETVCHRAFDAAREPIRSLEELVQLTITRVLTSGQKATATEGQSLIRELVDNSEGKIEILPGGGLRITNLREFVNEVRVNQVHLSAFDQISDHSMTDVDVQFNGRKVDESYFLAVSAEAVQAISNALTV